MPNEKQDKLMDNELLPALQQATELVISDQIQYAKAGEDLVLVKVLEKKVKEVFNPLCDAANKAHKIATATRKEHLKPVQDAEKMLKSKMLEYSGENEVQKIAGISTSDNWDIVIEDESKIPRKYMIPDVKTLKNIAKASKNTLKIAGIKFVNNRNMATRV